jgi:hypothetical protein
MLGLEKTNSEYLLRTFQAGKGAADRVDALIIVLIINAALFGLCFFLIKAQGKDEEPEDQVEWKFAY